MPLEEEIGEKGVTDGGTWGQPFYFHDNLAHIIVPRIFTEETYAEDGFRQWEHEQDIAGLAKILNGVNLKHHVSDHALEIKLF